MGKEISEASYEELLDEVSKREDAKRQEAIKRQVDRIRDDIAYISDTVIEGSPGSGSYSITFNVKK